MPWIKVVPEHEADDELKEVYKKIREQRQGEQSIAIATLPLAVRW